MNSFNISKFILLTGKIRMSVSERGIIKKNHERWKSCYSKVVYNMKVIKLPFACPGFSVHAQNQRQTGSFVQSLGFCTTCHFPLQLFLNLQFQDDPTSLTHVRIPTSLTHVRIRRDFQYIWTSHIIHRFNKWIVAVNVIYLYKIHITWISSFFFCLQRFSSIFESTVRLAERLFVCLVWFITSHQQSFS